MTKQTIRESKNLLPRQLGDTHIRLLRVFRVVIESGGFAAAEVELNISRPAISLAISELEEWLERPHRQLPTSSRKSLVIKNSDNEKVFVEVKNIIWIDAAGNYMCIHTQAETFIVRSTMKKLESELEQPMFSRIHKSTLVNIEYVKGIQPLNNNESMLDLGDNIKLKVSRNYSETVKKIIEVKNA